MTRHPFRYPIGVVIGVACLVAVLPKHQTRVDLLPWTLVAMGKADERAGATCHTRYRTAGTITVGRAPFALAVDTRTRRAFVKNMDGTVSVLDTAHNALLRVVRADVPNAPGLFALAPAVAVDAAGTQVFVANGGAGGTRHSGSVSVLDAQTGLLLHTIATGRHPIAVAIDTQRARAFVSNYGDGAVSVLDTRTDAVLRTTRVGGAPASIAVVEPLGRVFVTNNSVGRVTVLAAATGQVVQTIPVSANTAAVDARTGRVFVASVAQPGTALGDGALPSVEPPGAIDNGVIMLDAASGAVLRILPIRYKYAPGHLRALAVDEQTGRLFVIHDGDIDMFDAANGTHLATIDVGTAPAAVGVDEQRGCAFVTHWDNVSFHGNVQGSGRTSILDATSGRSMATLPVGWAPIAVATDEPHGQVFILNLYPPLSAGTENGSVTVIEHTRVVRS